MDNIPFLAGKRLILRHLEESDADGPYAYWLNDDDVCKGNSHHVFPYSIQDARDFISGSKMKSNMLVLAIVDIQKGIHIGNIALDKINKIYRSAELTILIGNIDYWGKGYGLEAARLICNHGFLTLNLHRIGCGTFENNAGMRKLAEKLGMIEEGKRRQAVYKNGRYIDVIEYGVLKEEYFKGFKLS